jgi:hypothetical protein
VASRNCQQLQTPESKNCQPFQTPESKNSDLGQLFKRGSSFEYSRAALQHLLGDHSNKASAFRAHIAFQLEDRPYFTKTLRAKLSVNKCQLPSTPLPFQTDTTSLRIIRPMTSEPHLLFLTCEQGAGAVTLVSSCAPSSCCCFSLASKMTHYNLYFCFSRGQKHRAVVTLVSSCVPSSCCCFSLASKMTHYNLFLFLTGAETQSGGHLGLFLRPQFLLLLQLGLHELLLQRLGPQLVSKVLLPQVVLLREVLQLLPQPAHQRRGSES